MIEVRKLASNLEKSTQYVSSLWETVLEQSLKDLQLESDYFLILVNSMDSPEKLKIVLEIFRIYETPVNQNKTMTKLIDCVDLSPFNLAQWWDALIEIHLWLKKHPVKTNLDQMVDYLSCCTESPDCKTTRQDFKNISQQMLNTYGYEAPESFE